MYCGGANVLILTLYVKIKAYCCGMAIIQSLPAVQYIVTLLIWKSIIFLTPFILRGTGVLLL